jgi:hypothetical protein
MTTRRSSSGSKLAELLLVETLLAGLLLVVMLLVELLLLVLSHIMACGESQCEFRRLNLVNGILLSSRGTVSG